MAISDILTGLLGAVGVARRALGREREAGPAPAGASGRCLDPRGDAGQPRQPGAERVRRRARARAGSATPTRTSSRTRPSRPPTARWPWRSGRSGSGRGCAPRSGWPGLADGPAIRDQRRPGREPVRAAPDPRGAFADRTTADWIAALDAAEIPAGRSTTSPRRSLRQRRSPGHDASSRSTRRRVRSVRSGSRSSCRATPGLDPHAAADPRPGHRRDPQPSWAMNRWRLLTFGSVASYDLAHGAVVTRASIR